MQQAQGYGVGRCDQAQGRQEDWQLIRGGLCSLRAERVLACGLGRTGESLQMQWIARVVLFNRRLSVASDGLCTEALVADGAHRVCFRRVAAPLTRRRCSAGTHRQFRDVWTGLGLWQQGATVVIGLLAPNRTARGVGKPVSLIAGTCPASPLGWG